MTAPRIDRVSDNSPVILVLPGGGYRRHAPHEGEPVAEWLRGLGWRARVVEYPVLTRHPGPLCAVQREIARERDAGTTVVGVLGFSAGGHLAGLAALTPDAPVRPDFAVLCYPVVTMGPRTHSGSRENLLGPRPSRRLQRATSLERLVAPDSVPLFVWTTGADAAVIPADHSYPLVSALAAAGAPHEFHVFPEGGHGLGFAEGLPAEAWRGLCARWLDDQRAAG